MRDPATGEYTGFFADLCREFAEALKVKPEFVDTTWDNIVAGLQAGKWDVSLALNRTPARAMAVKFSIPAMEYQISLAYNKENPKIPAGATSVADIDKEGVTLAVMSGTAQDKAISAAVKTAQILRLPGNDETRLAVTFKACRHPRRRLRHQSALHAVQSGMGCRAQSDAGACQAGRRLRPAASAFGGRRRGRRISSWKSRSPPAKSTNMIRKAVDEVLKALEVSSPWPCSQQICLPPASRLSDLARIAP